MRSIASALRRGLLYIIYVGLSLVAIYVLIEWAHSQVLTAALGVPAAMKAAEQTRVALTPTPIDLPTPAAQK